MPAADQFEGSAVLVLVALFAAIIGQGLFLALSVSTFLHCHAWKQPCQFQCSVLIIPTTQSTDAATALHLYGSLSEAATTVTQWTGE